MLAMLSPDPASDRSYLSPDPVKPPVQMIWMIQMGQDQAAGVPLGSAYDGRCEICIGVVRHFGRLGFDSGRVS